jgi:hypothetical protein
MASTQYVCKTCGYSGKAQKAKKGSVLIEIVLWVFTAGVLGIIYSIWRRTGRKNMCPTCSGLEMIPTDSPIGQKLLAEQKQPV